MISFVFLKNSLGLVSFRTPCLRHQCRRQTSWSGGSNQKYRGC